MARNKNVKLNLAGFQDLRTLPKVAEFVHGKAEELAERAGVRAEKHGEAGHRARSAAVGPGSKVDAMLLALGEMTGASIYVTKAGRARFASEAQISNWTRGSRSNAAR